MNDTDVAGQPEQADEPVWEASSPVWYWIVVLIVLFMCLALAAAVIQTQVQ